MNKYVAKRKFGRTVKGENQTVNVGDVVELHNAEAKRLAAVKALDVYVPDDDGSDDAGKGDGDGDGDGDGASGD